MIRLLFDRWSLGLFLGGVATLALLVFAAGVLLGRGPVPASPPPTVRIPFEPLWPRGVPRIALANAPPAAAAHEGPSRAGAPVVTRADTPAVRPSAPPASQAPERAAKPLPRAKSAPAPARADRVIPAARTTPGVAGDWALRHDLGRDALRAYLTTLEAASVELRMKFDGGDGRARVGFVEVERDAELVLGARFERTAGDRVARLVGLDLRVEPGASPGSGSFRVGPLVIRRAYSGASGTLCLDFDVEVLADFPEQLCVDAVRRDAAGDLIFDTRGKGALAELEARPIRITADGSVQQYRALDPLGLFRQWCPVREGAADVKVPGWLAVEGWPPPVTDLLALLPAEGPVGARVHRGGTARGQQLAALPVSELTLSLQAVGAASASALGMLKLPDERHAADLGLEAVAAGAGRAGAGRITLPGGRGELDVRGHLLALELEGRFDGRRFKTKTGMENLALGLLLSGKARDEQWGEVALEAIRIGLEGRLALDLPFEDLARLTLSLDFDAESEATLGALSVGVAEGVRIETDRTVANVQAKGNVTLGARAPPPGSNLTVRLDDSSRFELSMPGTVKIGGAARLVETPPALQLPDGSDLTLTARGTDEPVLHAAGRLGTRGAGDVFPRAPLLVAVETISVDANLGEALEMALGDPSRSDTLVEAAVVRGARVQLAGSMTALLGRAHADRPDRLVIESLVIDGNLTDTRVRGGGLEAKVPGELGMVARVAATLDLDLLSELDPVRVLGLSGTVELRSDRSRWFSAATSDGRVVTGTLHADSSLAIATGLLTPPLLGSTVMETAGFGDGGLGGTAKGAVSVSADPGHPDRSLLHGGAKTRLESRYGLRFDAARLFTAESALAEPVRTDVSLHLELPAGAQLAMPRRSGAPLAYLNGPMKLNLEAEWLLGSIRRDSRRR